MEASELAPAPAAGSVPTEDEIAAELQWGSQAAVGKWHRGSAPKEMDFSFETLRAEVQLCALKRVRKFRHGVGKKTLRELAYMSCCFALRDIQRGSVKRLQAEDGAFAAPVTRITVEINGLYVEAMELRKRAVSHSVFIGAAIVKECVNLETIMLLMAFNERHKRPSGGAPTRIHSFLSWQVAKASGYNFRYLRDCCELYLQLARQHLASTGGNVTFKNGFLDVTGHLPRVEELSIDDQKLVRGALLDGGPKEPAEARTIRLGLCGLKRAVQACKIDVDREALKVQMDAVLEAWGWEIRRKSYRTKPLRTKMTQAANSTHPR